MTIADQLRVEQVDARSKTLVENLMQLYLHEFSPLTGWDVNNEGLYDYPWLERYWSTPGRAVFVFRVAGQVAGFALVGGYTMVQPPGTAKSLSEFFVLHKYRMQGVGAAAATAIFDRFPGAWEVAQYRGHDEATVFWRKVIGRYMGGRFEEHSPAEPAWVGHVQTFDNSQR
jgi:predicted acetyltransferase